jgi:hypothetical protein
MTQPNVIGLLEVPGQSKTNGDTFREHSEAITTHGDKPLMGSDQSKTNCNSIGEHSEPDNSHGYRPFNES